MTTTTQTSPTKDSLKSPVASSSVPSPIPLTKDEVLFRELKGAELQHGRKSKDLAVANIELNNQTSMLGQAIADDADPKIVEMARSMVEAAQRRVNELTAAVDVLNSRIHRIKADRRGEGQRLNDEEEQAALVYLHDVVGPRVDAWFEEGQTLVQTLVIPAFNRVRLLPEDSLRVTVMQAAGTFKHRLMAACLGMPGCTSLTVFLPNEKWSASLPKPKPKAEVK